MARSDPNTLSGAVRSPRRSRGLALPYTRDGNGNGAPPSAFPQHGLRSSQSMSNLRRSGSEGLLSGIKSMFSRPLAWLATPTRPQPAQHPQGTKRDHLSPDPEDPPSPSERRATKRARRGSPDKRKSPKRIGPYEPAASNLPPLPATISLSRPRSSLAPSASMPYLDPPKSLLGASSPRTTLRPRGSLARSSRMDFGADEFGSAAGASATPDRRRTLSGAPEAWSPWREKTPRASLAASPFMPASASRGLARSQTLTNVREDASDVSMSRMRAGSGFGTFGGRSRLLPKSSTMRFDSVAEDDDAMSIVSDRNDVFAERAARHASLTPVPSRLSVLPSHSKPMGEPKMVYVPGRGFVKVAETPVPKPAPKNDADRILEALEASRQATSSLLPTNLVGASTRQLRKAIAVPLATSASASERKGHKAEWLSHGGGISSAISPYGRRRAVDMQARELRRELRAAESETDVSDMEVDGSALSVRSAASSRRRSPRSRSMTSISESEGGSDMSVSDARSPSPPRRSVRRSTRKGKSPATEEETPTLRRSRRLRTIEETASSPSKPVPSPRSKRVKSPPASATPRASRRRKATTPPSDSTSPEPAATPAVPVIKETAPSPIAASSYRVRDDSAPRERSSLRAGPTRNRQHQGAASYTSSRATSPGAGGGSGRFSAREEDLPDMDELEKLSKTSTAKFSGFSMPSFPTFEKKDEAPTEPKENGQLSSRIAVAPQQPAAVLSLPSSSLKPLGGRIGSTRPRASSPLASSSFTAEPDSPQTKEKQNEAAKEPQAPPAGGFYSLSGSAASTPGLTPPGAAGSTSDFFAPPKSPVKASGLGLGKPSTPPSGGIPNFFGGTTTPTAPPPKAPVFDFGNIESAEKSTEKAASPAPFSFGKPVTPAPTETPKAPFSFGAPSTTTDKPTDKPDNMPQAFDFGAKSVEKPADPKPFPSGAPATLAADKAADAPKAPFSFGAPSAPADKPTQAAKAPFSFGAPSAPAAPAANKPTESPKALFSFGAPSAAPADKPAQPAKAPFSFGAPSAPAADKPAETKAPFSFGSSGSTPAPADKTTEAPKPFSFAAAPSAPGPTGAANGDKPAFSFGAQSSTPAAGSGFGSGSMNFSFGGEKKADAPPAPASTSSHSFGNSPAPGPSAGFGAKPNGDTAKPFGFGNTSSTLAPSSGFNFGSNTSAPSTGFGSTSNSSAPTGFGAPVTSPTTTTASTGFGVTSPTTGFGTGSGFGSASSSAANSAPKPSLQFGNSSAAPATGGFGTPPTGTGFGSTAAPSTGFGAPAPASGGFNFGSNTVNAGSNSSPSSSSAPTFNFGATSGSSTPTGLAPGFQFGAPANTASTGNAPFQFGAPTSTPAQGFGSTPNTGPGSTATFGAPAPGGVRFGSPAPGAGAAPDGFSMGVGAEAPGSPGGRKIKSLRRGAVKR